MMIFLLGSWPRPDPGLVFLSCLRVINNYHEGLCKIAQFSLARFSGARIWSASLITMGRGDGLEVELMSRNPEGRSSIPRLGSRRSSLISIEHAELLRSTPSLVLCCVWLITMALHVHFGLGQLSPLPTSGDDKWVAAKHCGRAKRSRISDTHRLRSSLQFRYINNQSLLYRISHLYCVVVIFFHKLHYRHSSIKFY